MRLWLIFFDLNIRLVAMGAYIIRKLKTVERIDMHWQRSVRVCQKKLSLYSLCCPSPELDYIYDWNTHWKRKRK